MFAFYEVPRRAMDRIGSRECLRVGFRWVHPFFSFVKKIELTGFEIAQQILTVSAAGGVVCRQFPPKGQRLPAIEPFMHEPAGQSRPAGAFLLGVLPEAHKRRLIKSQIKPTHDTYHSTPPRQEKHAGA